MSSNRPGPSASSPGHQVPRLSYEPPHLEQHAEHAAMEEDESSQELEEETKETPINKELFVVQIPGQIKRKQIAASITKSARASLRTLHIDIQIERGPSVKSNGDEREFNTGRWTQTEHERFMVAIELYGKDWKKVQHYVGTRTSTQARSHAQKVLRPEYYADLYSPSTHASLSAHTSPKKLSAKSA